MAKMIPAHGPRAFDPASKEDRLYHALEKLSDPFVVIHSMTFATLDGKTFRQSEGDFVVFHKNLGILCIEAKAGQVNYSDGLWRYGNGKPIKKGGPFIHAMNICHDLRALMEVKGLRDLADRCKILHAVWFMDLSRQDFKDVYLPSEASVEFMLDASDLIDPEPMIRRVFSHKVGVCKEKPGGTVTKLNDKEASTIIDRVLCPQFSVVPTGVALADTARVQFAVLLDEQKRILDFMEAQRSAVISGSAGTGKTLIALEKARRLAERGERVLFLCYNNLLKKDLERRCADMPRIKVYTIAGFACSLCGTPTADYDLLAERLDGMREHGGFPFDHVVVDEGQDFGREEFSETLVLYTLKDLVCGTDEGTFYLFYDKNQLIQGTNVPEFISDADCKMTLYVNCRNTGNIAKSAARSLGAGATQVAKTLGITGAPPTMLFSTDRERQALFVDESLHKMSAAGAKTRVILTCKTEKTTTLGDYCTQRDGQVFWRNTKIPLYSCRRFKGLEADGIVLVDVNREIWDPHGHYAAGAGLLYYTGASRARLALSVVCDMGDEDAKLVLEKLGATSTRAPKKRLAQELNAMRSH